jgi:ABC-type branched-subunit amino acid transport system substrate-binding protein
VAVQKAHELIDRDKVNFLVGNVNSAMALALGEASNQAGILHIVTGGDTIRTPLPTAIGTCSASATRRAWRQMRSASC